MCGIAGYFGDFAPALLAEMGAAIAHRGPDGQGTWAEGRVGLAHARLAIIDLSPAGAQPMASADRRVVLTFTPAGRPPRPSQKCRMGCRG